ncbi:MAG: hypothetical protein ACREBB_11365 [Nitrosotalea sp.]
MGVKGLGAVQLKERKKTDARILKFIRDNPPCYTRQIIKETAMSPNSVVASLRRLRDEKKIITHKKSRFFKDSKIPSKALAYIPNHKDEKILVRTHLKNLNREQDALFKSLENSFASDFRKRKPFVKNFADVLSRGLKLGSQSVIEKMQRTLGIQDVNESMIGFYIFKFFLVNEKETGFAYGVGFYYDMLPLEYCEIDIQSPTQLIEFIKINFTHPLDLSQEIDSKFSSFNKKTRQLAMLHIARFFTSDIKNWLSLHGIDGYS